MKNRPEFTLLTIRFLGLASSSSFFLLSPVLARDVSKKGEEFIDENNCHEVSFVLITVSREIFICTPLSIILI